MDYESFSVQQLVAMLHIDPARQAQRLLAQGPDSAMRRAKAALKRVTIQAMGEHNIIGPLKSVGVREDFQTERWVIFGVFYGVVSPPEWAHKALQSIINAPRYGAPMPNVFHVVKETNRSYTR